MKTACRPKILAILLILVTYVNSEYVKVTTNKGELLGETVETELGKKVDVWRSIPYAKPPVGELRFKHPISNDPWTGVLNVTQDPNMCYQDVKNNKFFNIIYKELYTKQTPSEDCLYLSVVAPNPRPENAAVLVWIHGTDNVGSYTDPRLNFNSLASHGDIIIVAMQYRLSAFGFLYGRNPEIPGNAGIYDQSMALKWVKDNIKEFGGDPTKVTLAGQQYGSHYAGVHILSPISSQYFSQAILQSGAFKQGTLPEQMVYDITKYVAHASDCPVGNDLTDDAVQCLQSISAEKLASKTPPSYLRGFVDDKLIKYDDLSNITVGTIKKKNILMGNNKNEGSLVIAELATVFLEDDNFPEKVPPTNSTYFKEGINMFTNFLPKKSQDLLYYNYMSWDDPENSTTLAINLEKFYSDYLYNCDIDSFVDWAANNDWEIYRYLFSYRSEINLYPKWLGVYNGIELDFEFGLPKYRPIIATEEDRKMSTILKDYITSFVKTGNPNKHLSDYWKRFTADNPGYVEMDGDKTAFHSKWPLNKDCILWREFIYDDDSKCDTNDLTKEIDPNKIELNRILTVSKLTMTNIINPNSKHFNKINEKVGASSVLYPFIGFPSEAKTKTNTTTKFSKDKHLWTMIQESRSYTDIAD